MDVMEFTQAVSRIWVLETRLLDKSKIERMIDSQSADDALKVLGETEYSNVMSTVKRAADYEYILSAELQRVYALMYELCPVKEIVDMMSIKYKYHNLKVLLKGKLLDKDFSSMLIDLGNEDLVDLKRKIDGENYSQLSGFAEKAIVTAVNTFEQTKDPQQIDIVIDKYMFLDLVDVSQSLNYDFVDKYTKAIIDSTNIRTLLRVKKQGKNREFAGEVLIQGGAIEKDTLLSLLNESPESIIAKLNFTIYSDIIREGV